MEPNHRLQAAAHDDALPPQMLDLLINVGLGEPGEQLDDDEAEYSQEAAAAFFAQALKTTREVVASVAGEDAAVGILFDDSDLRSTPEITEDDFLPEEQPIFYALRQHMRALVSKNTPAGQRMKHLRWMMMPIADHHGLRFRDACQALKSRPTVVRTRALYQLWLNEIAIDECLPPLHETLPRFLAEEIGDHPAIGHIAGIVQMARTVWSLPGQPIDVVLKEALDRGVTSPSAVFATLEDYGYTGRTSTNRVYFLTRNPTQMSYRNRSHFSWAQSLVAAPE